MNFPKSFHHLNPRPVNAATNGNAASNKAKVEEEESNIIDPQDELRLKCGQTRHISHLLDTLYECNDRVNGKSNTLETCEQELFDYVHALDHCVAKTLFSRLA